MNFTPKFDELEVYTKTLKAKFLSQFIPANPAHQPDDYKHDVSAFCVLFHAALEGYFEYISEECVKFAVDQWIKYDRKTDVLVSLCINCCKKLSFNEDGNLKKPLKQMIREQLEATRSNFIKGLEGNHGASKKYLSKMLAQIGIDISCDAFTEDALGKIVEYRGEFAHMMPKKSLSPEDADKYATDCLLYCAKITGDAQDALKIA